MTIKERVIREQISSEPQTVTINLKNGDYFGFGYSNPDFDQCAIFFADEIDVDGLSLQGCMNVEVDNEKEITPFMLSIFGEMRSSLY